MKEVIICTTDMVIPDMAMDMAMATAMAVGYGQY